jgi:DNA repair protein RecN
MLSQLSIQNIAVIEKASLNFESGFTVMTGETGAGKSIIIDSIGAILGERTSKELVRTGEKAARVSALFTEVSADTNKCLEELNIPLEEDGSVFIQREIKSEGKSLCRINGMAATVSMLKILAPTLISIHGQHDSYELLSENTHLGYVDSFGGLEPLLSKYQAEYKKLKQIQKRLEALQTDEGQKARRIDLLTYQIDELAAADIKPGEQEALKKERDTIRHSEKLAEEMAKVQALLLGGDDEGGALSGLTEALTSVEMMSELLTDLKDAPQKLREAIYLIEDVESTVRSTNVDFDPALLEETEDRLDMLYRLSLKYGETEEEMLSFLEKCQTELDEINFSEEEMEKLTAEFEEAKQKAISLAKDLSKKRKKSADKFVEKVREELLSLNMPGVIFTAEIVRVPLYNMGCDKIQFLISVNKGEEPRPMTKTASGGELSRIMLAIKAVLSEGDKIATMIFDEIDTGISGEAANRVGEKLKKVAKNRQVVCITHLAQIAALASHQMFISKREEDGKTFTKVEPLDENGRVRELARIIGGDIISDLRLDMAKEMLRKGLDK